MLNHIDSASTDDAAAASRFAGELANVRILLDNCKIERDKMKSNWQEAEDEVEALNALVWRIHQLSPENDTVRKLCEDALLGKVIPE